MTQQRAAIVRDGRVSHPRGRTETQAKPRIDSGVWRKQPPHLLARFSELPGHLSESDFQWALVVVAQHFGWMVTHFRPALTQSGRWTTPLQGDRGFPDTVLARDGVTIFAELKTNKGRLSAEQKQWIEHLGESGRVWRPRDWQCIVTELKPRKN